jgi:hypothetical protein|tara:strand:- start:274 stop:459 length:186 start_codon:yes stop_codon:yes gene_type:complete
MAQAEDSNTKITNEIIELIHELVDVHGSDGMAFYNRLEIRRAIREKLAELNCEKGIIEEAH